MNQKDFKQESSFFTHKFYYTKHKIVRHLYFRGKPWSEKVVSKNEQS